MVETWIIDGVRYTTEPTEWSYDELEQQRTDLLEALKELFAAYEALSKENDLSKLADPMFRLTNAVVKAKQAIDKAEGEV